MDVRRLAGRRGFDVALLLTMSAIWGSSYLWTKLALRSFGPALIVCARMGAGALALGVIVAATGTRLPRRPGWYARLAGLSVVNVTVPFTLITWGQQFIGSALASVLSSTTPLFVFVAAVATSRDERVSWLRVGGTTLAFGGVLLLVGGLSAGPGSGAGEPGQPGAAGAAGVLAVLASSAVFGCGNVLSRHVTRETSPLLAAFAQLAFGCVFEIPIVLAAGEPVPAHPSAVSLLALGWLGVMGSGVTYLIYFRLLARIGSTRTSMNTYLQPVVGVLAGVLVLGEALGARAVLAMAVTFAGVATFAAGSRKQLSAKRRFYPTSHFKNHCGDC